ncbi:MAG: type IV secretion protein IcmK [Legionellales bacterium]|nr:type IV secretion protein IcmK [Legionellales bacterium]OUX64193.1 MAG: hypothetical protein CBE41_03835 [Gammaproteobacteria bacterium TMED281]
MKWIYRISILIGVLLQPGLTVGQQVSDEMARQLAEMAAESKPTFKMDPQTEELQGEAFDKLPTTLFPLTPEQIKVLRDLFVESKQAAAYTQPVPTRPTSSALVVDLTPGATPPVIRLGAGYVTSLIFLDAAGEAWPIKGYDIGNPTAFNVLQPTAGGSETGGNTLLIQSNTMFKDGNLAVILKGLNTPIMITLLPGQKAVDYRVDIQVPRAGPSNKGVHNMTLPSTINPVLLDFINQLPPKGSKQLVIKGAAAQGWLYKDRVYLRTPLTLISPGWVAKLSGSDGNINAYEVTEMMSQIILLDNGEMKHATVEGL